MEGVQAKPRQCGILDTQVKEVYQGRCDFISNATDRSSKIRKENGTLNLPSGRAMVILKKGRKMGECLIRVGSRKLEEKFQKECYRRPSRNYVVTACMEHFSGVVKK